MTSFSISHGSGCAVPHASMFGGPHVSLADLMTARPSGISEHEVWAVLFQAVQALQDLLLSDGVTEHFTIPFIHPGTLFLTSRGRVTLSLTKTIHVPPYLNDYVAPEFRHNKPKTDSDVEKMLVYSLGRTLKGATTNGQHMPGHVVCGPLERSEPSELCKVLTTMGKQLSDERASLMHLLDVISEYSKRKEQTKPFSHTIMDLYRETIIYKNMLPDIQEAALKTYYRNFTLEPYNNRNILHQVEPSNIKSTHCQKWNVLNPEPLSRPNIGNFRGSLEQLNLPIPTDIPMKHVPKQEEKTLRPKRKLNSRRQPVKRAASRLYRAIDADKSLHNDQNNCIGPEFVIRAVLPSKQLSLDNYKCENGKKLTIIMLNGVKLELFCKPESTTAGQLFSKIVQSESIEENFFLGLSVLIGGDFVFVPSDLKISKIMSAEQGTDTLFVRVRFFLPSLRGIRNPQSRHLLYLQLRRSMLENQLPCTVDKLCELGGLALQAEFGDYTDKHKMNHYFLLEHYIPEITLENSENVDKIRKSLTQMHIQRCGLSVEKSKELFILQAQTLQYYGFHIYSATWVNKNMQNDIWLCISAKGLNLYKRSSNGILDGTCAVQEIFKWQSIQTLCYSKQYLCILPHNTPSRKTLPRKYKLKMDHKKSYYVFRLASLHHQFFLRLRNEYSSLQPLSEQFGVLLKEIKNETNSLCKLGQGNDPEPQFKSYTKSRNKNTLKSSKCKRSKSVNELSFNKNIPLEEYQNKENEFDNRVEDTKNFMSLPQSGMWDKRKGVIMGTRAFSSGGPRVSRSLEAVNACIYENSDKLSTVSSTNISITDAYVLNSSIKSCDDEFLPNFQETLNETLMNKLRDMSFADERLLKSVTINRDQYGSLGIQVTEGTDGKAYIQSVVPGSPAYLTRNIFRGDQIVAVNGQNLLNLKYDDALEILKNTGSKVELVLSQLSSTFRQTEPEIGYTVDRVTTHQKSFSERLCGVCNPQSRCTNFNIDKKYDACTCNLMHSVLKENLGHYSKVIDKSGSNLYNRENTLDVELNKMSCNNFKDRHPIQYSEASMKVLNHCNTCTKINYEDCDIMKKSYEEIALPRRLGLGRRWRGPVRYPVTPIKKSVSNSGSESSVILNTSDEEQIFI